MNAPAATLSVIIVAKNEAHDIADCILSARDIATEIIVFDSGSTDGTPDLCRQLGATVVVTPDWPGDGPQKNRALDTATGDWVLSLDADERLDETARNSVMEILRLGSKHTAFQIRRDTEFCGRFMNRIGYRPDMIVRLFKRTEARFTPVFTHTQPKFKGTLGKLAGRMIHLAVPTIDESLEKMNASSSAGAKSLHAKGRRSSVTEAAARGVWAFLRAYFLRLGFLDGREGFILAVLNAEGSFHKYAKLVTMK